MRILIAIALVTFAWITAIGQSPTQATKPDVNKDNGSFRLERYEYFAKAWTLTTADRDELLALTVQAGHDAKSLNALLQIIDSHSSPRNPELLLDILHKNKYPNIALRTRCVKALGECFYNQEAWHNALMLVGNKPAMQALLDEATIEVGSPVSGWWLSERVRLNQLRPDLELRAMSSIGLNGDNSDYETAQKTIATNRTISDERRKLLSDQLEGSWTRAENYRRENGLGRHDKMRELLEKYKSATPDQKRKLTDQMIGETITKGRARYIPHELGPAIAIKLTEAEKTEFENGLTSEDDSVVIKTLLAGVKVDYPSLEALANIISSSKRSDTVRMQAMQNLELRTSNASESMFDLWRGLLASEKTPKALMGKAISGLSKSKKLLDLIALQDALPGTSAELQKQIALALANTKDGANLLLASASKGKVPSKIVTDTTVVEKLKATGVRDLDERLKGLPR